MGIVTVLVLSLGLSATYGLRCGDISGTWQNELGSRMVLSVDASSRISGEYYTAVETKPGASAFTSNITGLYSTQKDGSLLAFSVLFNHGSSLTSWVGQCTVCDGKEILHTTYTFRKYTPNHQEKWAATVVNHNTFWRFRDEAENELVNAGTVPFSPVISRSVVSNKKPGGVEVSGKWKSNDREEIEILGHDDNVLKGRHHAADLIGRKDGNDMFTAVTLVSTLNKRVRSWTGHIYHSPSTVPNVLEASWLEHEFNPSCTESKNMVRFGAQNFTRVTAEAVNNMSESETFLEKIRKFFSNMF